MACTRGPSAAQLEDATYPIRRSPSHTIRRLALTVVAVGSALLTWAWSDVLVWQRIFESRGLDQYDAAYQAGHQWVLVGLIVLGSVLLLQSGVRWSITFAAAVYTLAYGGAADVLYYWLDGRAMPAALPWLDVAHPLILFHPVTSRTLLASAAIWMAVWAVGLVTAQLASLGLDRRRARGASKTLTGARATS